MAKTMHGARVPDAGNGDGDAASRGPNPGRGGWVLFAGALLALVFGSVHAFSVFLEPLERQLAQSRATVSLTYALALVFLTIGVLVGHRLYALLRPPLFVAAVCLLAAAGAAVAAGAGGLLGLWLGYSLIFGWANGLAYGYALQISAQAVPRRTGAAMALITAAYGLGAALAPAAFAAALAWGGFPAAMLGLALALLAVVPICAAALHHAGILFASPPASGPGRLWDGLAQWGRHWLGYGSAVAAGLMALGHASAIAQAAGLSAGAALAAPAVISLSGIPGCLLGGWSADRLPYRPLLVAWPLVSALGLFGLAAAQQGWPVLLCLALIGLAYGALIVVYPAAIAGRFGALAGVKVYGRVFTAWGTAGLIAPWLAGTIYDSQGGYGLAMALAGLLSLLSAAIAVRLGTPP